MRLAFDRTPVRNKGAIGSVRLEELLLSAAERGSRRQSLDQRRPAVVLADLNDPRGRDLDFHPERPRPTCPPRPSGRPGLADPRQAGRHRRSRRIPAPARFSFRSSPTAASTASMSRAEAISAGAAWSACPCMTSAPGSRVRPSPISSGTFRLPWRYAQPDDPIPTADGGRAPWTIRRKLMPPSRSG